MTYNIFGKTAPAMPKTSRGTEFVKIALSQASKDMQEVLIPMAMPALSAHLTETKFMYSDNKYYEMCGQMGHLIGPSGIGKAQLGHLVEAIMRPFRQHDEIEFKKLVDWQRQMKTKGANKEKPERPGGELLAVPSSGYGNCSSVQRPRCTSSKNRREDASRYYNSPPRCTSSKPLRPERATCA